MEHSGIVLLPYLCFRVGWPVFACPNASTGGFAALLFGSPLRSPQQPTSRDYAEKTVGWRISTNACMATYHNAYICTRYFVRAYLINKVKKKITAVRSRTRSKLILRAVRDALIASVSSSVVAYHYKCQDRCYRRVFFPLAFLLLFS